MTRTAFFIDSVRKTSELNIKFRGMLPNQGRVGNGWYISEVVFSMISYRMGRCILQGKTLSVCHLT
jgi:hypothetical protein